MDFNNLDSYSQKELEEILNDASNSYYNTGKEELTDEEFLEAGPKDDHDMTFQVWTRR